MTHKKKEKVAKRELLREKKIAKRERAMRGEENRKKSAKYCHL